MPKTTNNYFSLPAGSKSGKQLVTDDTREAFPTPSGVGCLPLPHSVFQSPLWSPFSSASVLLVSCSECLSKSASPDDWGKFW